jgi:pimeloyl-ACP methyl ester carboxylesterase
MVWHRTIGRGPTKVLVIHGWFWDHRVFTPLFDALDGDRFTYAFVDIRGYGHSKDVAGNFYHRRGRKRWHRARRQPGLARISHCRSLDGWQGGAEARHGCACARDIRDRSDAGSGNTVAIRRGNLRIFQLGLRE